MVSLRYAGALGASSMFGQAIILNWGGYSDPAVTWVILGLILVGFLFASPGRFLDRTIPAKFATPVLWLCVLVLAIYAASFTTPLLYASGDWSLGRAARWGLCAVIFTYGLALVHPEARWLRHARFGVIAALVLLMGVEVVRTSPSPLIDVWTVQQEGAKVFLDGRNPFQDVHLKDTGPRTADDVPYVYPPVQLYVSSVVYALLGDVRYGTVLALLVLGFLARAIALKVTRARELPAIFEDAPALFIWCTPMLAFILEQAWIDPIQVCCCSALLLAWDRPWLAAVLAGLLLGSKQTMLFVVLPVALALRLNWKQWFVIGVVGLLPLVPWLIWDFKAYKHANFDFLNALPVREDALTVVTWAKKRLHLQIPWAIGFVSAAVVIAIAARRGAQSLEKTAITVLAAMTFLFTFNKWAFANYYFTLLSLAALAGAAATAPKLEDAAVPITTDR